MFAQYDVIREIFIEGAAYMREEDLHRIKDYLYDPGVWDHVLSTRVAVDNVKKYYSNIIERFVLN